MFGGRQLTHTPSKLVKGVSTGHEHVDTFAFHTVPFEQVKHTSFTESHFVSQATQLLSPSRYGVVIGHEHFKVDGSMTKPLGQRRQVNV